MKIPSPYLVMAVFCERALIEQDGTISVIRIVDRVTKHPVEGDKRKPVARINLAMALKAGDYVGKGTVRVVASAPSGKQMGGSAINTEVEMRAGDTGANVIAEVVLALEEDGLYWFEVYFNDRLMTRTPVSVVSGPQETSPKQEAAPNPQKSSSH